MYNWSTDASQLKQGSKQRAIWQLEQMVNFGLDGGKLNARDLKRYWPQLAIDPDRRRFLELLLYER